MTSHPGAEDTELLRGAANVLLSAAQLDVLREWGEERAVAAGDVLFRAGDLYDFISILEGRVAVVDDLGGHHESVVAEHGPGRFIGEYRLLLGQPAPFSAVALEPTRVIAVPAAGLRAIIDNQRSLSEVILTAFLARRAILIGKGLGLKVVGSGYSTDTRRLLEFATRNRVPFSWLDVERDASAEELLQEFQIPVRDTPVVIAGSIVLRNPSNEDLAQALGFVPAAHTADVFDLLVVGAGPAGLAAAVYGASEGLTTLTIETVAVGGQAGTSTRIENYLGFPAGLSGGELAARAQLQAQKFNARITVPCQAVALEESHGLHLVRLSSGDEVLARAVIIATGAQYMRLALERLAEFEGLGVYYAATPAEAAMCAGDAVAVVGGGNSAGQAAVFLAARSRRVYVIIRRGELADTMSRYLIDQIERHDNIELVPHTEVRTLLGAPALDGIEVENRVDSSRRTLGVGALFVFIGAEPHTTWLSGAVALDARGFILTGRDLPDGPDGSGHLPLETSRPGVFAAGDVRSGSIKRVASAVGEGSMAVRLVHDHLSHPRAVQPAG